MCGPIGGQTENVTDGCRTEFNELCVQKTNVELVLLNFCVRQVECSDAYQVSGGQFGAAGRPKTIAVLRTPVDSDLSLHRLSQQSQGHRENEDSVFHCKTTAVRFITVCHLILSSFPKWQAISSWIIA